MRINKLTLLALLCAAFLAELAVPQSQNTEYLNTLGVEPASFDMSDRENWVPPKKLLIPNNAWLMEAVERAGTNIEVVVFETEQEAVALANDVDAIFATCSADIIDAAPRAAWVQVFTAGVDRCFGSDKIASGQVVLTNFQKLSSPAIADHAIALTLALGRALPQFAKAMSRGEWLARGGEAAAQMESFSGKTLLVAGLGGIGTEVARRASALEMEVVATRRSSRDGPEFVDYVGLSHELFELAARADFIVNALPLTNETENLFDAKFFAAAKKGAIFVSVGRGKSVVTGDLLDALQQGQIGGAGLDVTEPEPLPPDHPLWQAENVIITPHVAARAASRDPHRLLLIENLQRFAAGNALLNVVDAERGY